MTQLPINWMQFKGGPGHAVALHCGLAHGGAWHGVAGHLTDQVTVRAPDLPGHGRSPDWDGQGDVAHRIIDAISSSILPNTHLIGHSFGAVLALRLAQILPERVTSLTLIEPVLFAAARINDPEAFAAYEQRAAPFAEAIKKNAWEDAARKFTGLWGTGERWESLPLEQRDRMTRQMRMIAGSQSCVMEDSLQMLDPNALATCRMPVLLMRGQATDPILSAIQTALLAKLPNARETVIAGAGHMVPISHPDQVGPVIGRHIVSAF
ncbi:MAG: alpha/beta hydrolase [Rhodobacteraceae bacterium]|nr:alpha/beta hydrolase [Paracoccaceae bacterium]